MKMALLKLGLTVGTLAVVAMAQGQVPAAVYLTGPTPELDGWGPGATASLQMKDDGTGGDAVAGDGIYTLAYTPTASTGGIIQWKCAAPGWGWSVPGDNSICKLTTGTVTKFCVDTNTKGDGWVPDPDGAGTKGFAYTIPALYGASDVIRVTGGFDGWNNTDAAAVMHDDGLNGDQTAGDGIYTLALPSMTPGTQEFKITVNGSWSNTISKTGYCSNDGGNSAFNVLASTDNVKIMFNAATGRVKVSNDNPSLNPGPPFFATSDAWGTALDNTTKLYDDGTMGDKTAGDKIYSRQFTVYNAPALEQSLQIKQFVGPTYPATGNYPIQVTTGTQCLVQFDTNTYSDGCAPSTRFVWTDPATRRTVSYVQAVGDFMVDLGNSDNWISGAPAFQLFDAGANGDVTSGDGIYAKTFTAPALTGKQFKAVGSEGGSWKYQFGGPGEGATVNGNNTSMIFSTAGGALTFQVDTVTGRVGVGAAKPTRPSTINAVPAVSAVSDWSLFN